MILIALAGCAASNSPKGVTRDLPQRPTWTEPVKVANPKTGENAIAVAARERAGRIEANSVITHFGEWYDSVRAGYRGE